MGRIFFKGDTHGKFNWLKDFCADNKTTLEDVLIILGDGGLRFEGPENPREVNRKNIVAACPITVIEVRGNHSRPYVEGNDVILMQCPFATYTQQYTNWMWHDTDYPNIWYFQDGESYSIYGKTFLVLGGAASIDKNYRLMMRWTWFEHEQINKYEMSNIVQKLDHHKYHYDFVLSHTCPFSWIDPNMMTISGYTFTPDYTTENFLDLVAVRISYGAWLCGHWHVDHFQNHENRFFVLFHKVMEANDFEAATNPDLSASPIEALCEHFYCAPSYEET